MSLVHTADKRFATDNWVQSMSIHKMTCLFICVPSLKFYSSSDSEQSNNAYACTGINLQLDCSQLLVSDNVPPLSVNSAQFMP